MQYRVRRFSHLWEDNIVDAESADEAIEKAGSEGEFKEVGRSVEETLVVDG